MSQTKLSARQALAVLREIPETLEKLAEERDELAAENEKLRNELAEYRLTERVEKVAGVIHQKGLDEGRSMDDTVRFLKEKHAEGKLDAIEQAVDMTVHAPMGYLGGGNTTGQGGSAEENFVSALVEG